MSYQKRGKPRFSILSYIALHVLLWLNESGMKLFFYPNTTEDRYLPKIKSAIHQLEDKGWDCSLGQADSLKIYGDDSYARFTIETSDMIVSLGGDGTLLRAAQNAVECDLPLLGINCGRYGNLCAYRLNELDSFDPACLIENKTTLLETAINGKTYLSVNDIVIGKDFFGGTIDLQVSFKEETAYRFIGDGLIISTPVGSTGYNRSAHGKVLAYDDDHYVVTAICPHNIDIDSTVLKAEVATSVALMNKKYSASIYIDGSYIGPFESLKIQCSKHHLRLLRRQESCDSQQYERTGEKHV